MASKITRALIVRELSDMRDAIDTLLVAAKRGAFDPCDCTHSSVQHGFIREPESPACGFRPCLIAGCDCVDFDDSEQQIKELRRKTRLAEAEARRLQTQLDTEQKDRAAA